MIGGIYLEDPNIKGSKEQLWDVKQGLSTSAESLWNYLIDPLCPPYIDGRLESSIEPCSVAVCLGRFGS